MSGEDALTFLMQRLVDVLRDYNDIRQGARREIRELQNELSRLQAGLRDAAARAAMSNNSVNCTFRENEKQIRELVYEVEDTIETCLTKKAAEKAKNIFARLPGILSTKMEEKVRNLRVNRVPHALTLLQSRGESIRRPPGQVNPLNDVVLIYNSLQHDERVCFLYTGLFPADYDIPASTLTQLWIAESFIRPEGNLTPEEKANQILDSLILNSLLTAGRRRLNQVKTCRVHDRVRDFCKRKAEEETLFTVIEHPVCTDPAYYRLCFHSDPSNFLPRKQTFPYVRSFLCLVNEPFYVNQKNISTIPKAFKPLRILSCKSTKFDELPKNITNLILLKHITLSIDNLEQLPEHISKLSNLQTLIIQTSSRMIRVKANIWKMMRLRHLKTKVSFILDDKNWRGHVSETLETISRLSTRSCNADLSVKAPNLKSLGIRGKLADLNLETLSLQNFIHLEKLKLVNYVRYGLASDHRLSILPRGQYFPRHLKRLTLSHTYLLWNRHMPILAEIDTLEVLKLKDNAFIGVLWKAGDGHVFAKLKLLLIKNMDLVIWEASTVHFPELECLVITNCEQLTHVPDTLAPRVER